MKKRQLLKRYAVLFAVLVGFTLVSTGVVTSQIGTANAVSSLRSEQSGDVFVSVDDDFTERETFAKQFEHRRQVCTLTVEQAAQVSALYDAESVAQDEGGYTVFVLENGLTKHKLEEQIGELSPERCRVVKGPKFLALFSPAFVS